MTGLIEVNRLRTLRPTFARARAGSLAAIVLGSLLIGCAAQDPESILADAQASFASGDYRTAVILVQNVLQADADNVPGRILFGKEFTDHSDEVWENAVDLAFLSHARLIRSASTP